MLIGKVEADILALPLDQFLARIQQEIDQKH